MLAEDHIEVHITCYQWLLPQWYAAVYVTADHSLAGRYLPYAYELNDKHDYLYLFKGTFERANL